MLEVEDLSVNYRGVIAVDRVSFRLFPGQLVGVIGPNGAGKSTMIKAMLGLIPASKGKVRYYSSYLKEKLSQVAYVPQRTQIDWDYPITVKNVVMMARTPHTGWFRSPSRQSVEIVKEALLKVGMWELRDRPIGELSGGQQQRIFLAQALAQQAKLFFFDEPFVGVDKSTEKIIFQIFEELKAEGKILMVVGHELTEAARKYDRFLLLNKHIIADGSGTEVIKAENIRLAYGDSMFLLQS